MDRPGDLVQWNIKIMTACHQITCAIPWLPCEQLPYPPEHPRISRMRQRDKSDLPLPVLSYKYFLLGYPFSIASFYSPNSAFLAAALFENSNNSSKSFPHQPPNLRSSSSWEDGHQLHRTWGQFITLLFCIFTVFLFIRNSFTKYLFSFLFVLPFILKTFRIWPIRSLFLSINPTSNVSAH